MPEAGGTQGEDVFHALASRFPRAMVRRGTAPGVVAVIDAPHPEVGGLELREAPNGFTIRIARRVSLHVPLDDTTRSARLDAIAALLDRIQLLLSDRLVIWTCGWMSGTRPRRPAETPRSGLLVRRFLWSGPLARAWAKPTPRAAR